MTTDSSVRMGMVNWLGLWTLYRREVWRFLKVWNQTVLAPMVTTLLFLAILTLALGGGSRVMNGLPFNQFVAPGLIMMAIVQNAFANTSSSLMLAKIQGVIIDILMPPLTGREIVFAQVMGGVTRGLLVGITVSFAIYVFVPVTLVHPLLALVYVLLASMMLALAGMLTGIWSQSFDQVAAVTNYIVTPLAFLSGTFYSIEHLPPLWQHFCHYNPFFYMIDGFRYALTGYNDGNIGHGLVVLTGVNVVLWAVTGELFARGWRLKT